MSAAVLGIQTVITVVDKFFGSDVGKAVLGVLTSRIPNLTDEDKAQLDQHFVDYLGWKF